MGFPQLEMAARVRTLSIYPQPGYSPESCGSTCCSKQSERCAGRRCLQLLHCTRLHPALRGIRPLYFPPTELGFYCDSQHTAGQHGRQHSLLAGCRRTASWQTCCGGQTYGPQCTRGASNAGGCQAAPRSGGISRVNSAMHTLTSTSGSVLHLCSTADVGQGVSLSDRHSAAHRWPTCCTSRLTFTGRG